MNSYLPVKPGGRESPFIESSHNRPMCAGIISAPAPGHLKYFPNWSRHYQMPVNHGDFNIPFLLDLNHHHS
jgi:hypothetical protein